jgi:hypothetical protein
VLGTLSAAGALVKRFEKIRFPPNVDNCVETMCTVHLLCGPESPSDPATLEPMWKPLRALV